jgi:hypothetical protein
MNVEAAAPTPPISISQGAAVGGMIFNAARLMPSSDLERA